MSTEQYYLKVQGLGTEKLLEEEKRLYDLLFKTSETSPMYQQIWDMLEMVQSTFRERQFLERRGREPDNEIIEIGKIEEVVYTPDYNSEELLIAVVNQYNSKTGGKR